LAKLTTLCTFHIEQWQEILPFPSYHFSPINNHSSRQNLNDSQKINKKQHYENLPFKGSSNIPTTPNHETLDQRTDHLLVPPEYACKA
jgi:hypothetical protein